MTHLDCPPDRRATLVITWDEEDEGYAYACAECIVGTLAGLEAAIVGRLDTDPRFTISTMRQEA